MAVRRVKRGDSIERAWDAGEPPPPEAYLPEHRETLLRTIYLRWGDVPTYRNDHPHLREWLAALEGV
jgi:hypothetical protein